MKREQKLCLAAGSLLLSGALVVGIGRIEPAQVEDGPIMADPGTRTRKAMPRVTGKGALPGMMIANRPASTTGSEDGPDPEDSPEFFAALVEEARPVLAEQLRDAVTRAHHRIVERELAALQRDGQLTDTQADSVRQQLVGRFATIMAADAEAVNDGTDAFTGVWNDTLARSDEWAAETRDAARKFSSQDR